MKNYYEVMGLTSSATEAQIKYVFRRLAITYHPDKNPAPEAEAIFKEVSEAYEILSDPVKRTQYDQLLLLGIHEVAETQPEPWHRDPAYRKRRAAGYRPPPQGPSPRVVMMQSFLGYLRILSWTGLAWCFLLVVDYALPSRETDEKIISDARSIRRMAIRNNADLLFTVNRHHFAIAPGELKYFPYESKLRIYSSALFSILVKLENEDRSYEVNNLATLYRNFLFAPALLLVLSLFGVFWNRGVEFRFNVGVVLILVSLLNMVFFFSSRI